MTPSIGSYVFYFGCLIIVTILLWDVVEEWNLDGKESNHPPSIKLDRKKNTKTTTSSSIASVAGYLKTVSSTSPSSTIDDIDTYEHYNTEQILQTIHSIRLAPARLLIYHPSNNHRFQNETIVVTSFTVAPSNVSDQPVLHQNSHVCLRCRNVLPLLVDLLLQTTTNDNRHLSSKGSHPIQFLFSAADYTANVCLQDGNDSDKNNNKENKILRDNTCRNTSQFAPWLHFGSGMRDLTWLPTFQIMPVTNYLQCITEWRWNTSIPQCMIWKLPNVTLLPSQNVTLSSPHLLTSKDGRVVWESLIPKIIWRGTGFPFLPGVGLQVFQQHNNTYLNHLPFEPRRIATEWSHHATNSSDDKWLDAMIVPWRHIDMSMEDMAHQYKYHIDLGGAGGTSWTGTLTKLAMPGLLFHHETPTMDWFYDKLRPWYHYVPIRTDLSDLRQKFEWAESHPKEARTIAEQARQMAHSLLSNYTLQYEYERLYRTIQGIVNAYQSIDSIETILKTYRAANVTVTPYATCTREYCDIQTTPNGRRRYPVPHSI
jgi:Glycosyl transferase family 90